MRRARFLWAVGALLGAALSATGCAGDFDPYERLTALRVLAIKSEPVAPAPGEMTMLSALVYTPPLADATAPPPALTYDWSWCPFVGSANDGYPCLVTADQIPTASGAPASFALGSGQTPMLKHDFDPNLLQAICAGMPGLPPPPDCREGFPVTIRLTVSTPDDHVTAIRTLSLLLAPAPQPNTNPTLTGLFGVDATGADQPLSMVTLRRQADNSVKADVPESASEAYDGFDDEGQPAQLQERLYISWFVETGTMKHARTGYNAATGTAFADLLRDTWRPERAALYRRDQATLIAVLRDNRDGVTWLSATAPLEPTP